MTTCVAMMGVATVLLLGGRANAQAVDELARMSIEELSNVEVISVFKRPQPLSRSPASVYVITHEEIRRSGAVSLPEALRLAPNLQVARADASSYAISARGFNTPQASNKLLVLIDGRSIYTPLHAGVFWDQQQLLLHDVERIEIVSGPGGTLWGANAVNGVINVVTRSASQTEGGVVTALAGNVDRHASVRYGGELGERGAFRVYGMGFERGDSLNVDGSRARDEWDGVQAGFRTDWDYSGDAFTVQGDVFDNSFERGSIRGANVLSRWSRLLRDGSLDVQAYYDKVTRDANRVLDELETFDVQLQHTFAMGEAHRIVWGAGHRITDDRFANRLNSFVLVPEDDTVQLSNVFLQDTFALREDLALTFGSKFEYSSFTGLEFLPSARLAWQVADQTLLWSAVSRAVRTPSRIDRNLQSAGLVDPARDFDSENLIAYEAGFRGQPLRNTTVSVSLFYNDYEELRMLTLSPATGRFTYANAMEGHTYGVEIWGDVQVFSWWRVSAGGNLLKKDLQLAPNALDFVLDQHAGNDPEHELFLRSSMDFFSPALQFDVAARAIDDLPDPIVEDYIEVDARLGWRLNPSLEIALTGLNLLDSQHPETGRAPARNELRRSGHLEVVWQF